MKRNLIAGAILSFALTVSASGDPMDARAKLLKLPHADVARLVGSWKVKEMEPIQMIYEFQLETMAMHGRNSQGGSSFELLLDADYRLAGEKAIWVIGTNPRPTPDGMDANIPSILGIEFTSDDEATMTVSDRERFTLVKVP